MSLLDDVERHRSDIETDSYTVTWRELISQYRDGDVKINPEYQRLFRWDVDQQSQYIESLILAIPSPPVFLAENEDSKYEVIDGLQRLSTLLKFFALERKDTPEQPTIDPEDLDAEVEQNDIRVPTVLAAGRILDALEGHNATTLPETLVRTIRYSRVGVILIAKGSKQRARYEVFRRLNRFGSLLSDQEIRNCTSRLLGTAFPDALQKLGKHPIVRSVLSLSDESRRKMGVEEVLLRLLAFNHSNEPLRHQIREYLDDFMEFASEGKFALTTEIAHKVVRAFEMIHEAIPDDGNAFRLKNQGFSTNLFDVVATGVYQNLNTLSPAILREKHRTLLAGGELKGLIGAGSNTRKKLEGRLNLGFQWFRGA